MYSSEKVDRVLWRDGDPLLGSRVLAEETAVAISYNGSAHAVLMATPADLEDLAIGFSITEGIVEDLSSIEDVTVTTYDLGLDVQIRVRDDIAERLASRRRSMAGPVGCGMCGLESLEAARRRLPTLAAGVEFSCSSITDAAQSLELGQELNRATAAVHAAGFFLPCEPVSFVREDVGRHNALDKLIGKLFRAGIAPSTGGLIVTSRVSVELVQKAAVAGCGLLAAVSAPTALAVRTAQEAGITLTAVVRGKSFEVFSHSTRVTSDIVSHVA